MRFDGIKNFKDLGGIPCENGMQIRKGILFRSGALNKASLKDRIRLSERLKIHDVIDLRTALERHELPDAGVDGVNNIHIPVFEESVIGITHETGSEYSRFIRHSHDREAIRAIVPDMEQIYSYVMTDSAIVAKMGEAIKKVIENVLEDRKTLFHCSEGKDRAGALSSLLLALLGAEEETIYRHYASTNRTMKKKALLNSVLVLLAKQDYVAARKVWRASIADPAYIKLSFDVIKERFGSLESFFREGIGISDETRSRFRAAALCI